MHHSHPPQEPRIKQRRLPRLAVIAVIVLLVLAAAAMTGLHYASRLLKTQVEAALGANSEVGEIRVGWSAIEVHRLRIRAPRGWPAAQTLNAQKITIVPDLRSLLADRSKVRIHSITIEDAYLSVLRTRAGRLRLLPSLLENKANQGTAKAAPPIQVIIGSIALHDGKVEFFDASVKQPAHKIRLEQLRATIADLHVPDLTGRTGIELDGVIKGVQRNGTLSIAGWSELASKNSKLATRLDGVDLIALQPYLIKAAETGVKRGTLDLRLQSTVHNKRLHAPGSITLSDLELSEKGGPFGTFMGLPRQAVITGLKNRDNQITMAFTLDGNLDDPRFSLNDSMAKNIGAAAAGLLGISIESLVKGIGDSPEGVGSVLKKMFGQ